MHNSQVIDLGIKPKAMKRILLLAIFVTICFGSFSQGIAINTNGASADASSMLDISSSNKGVLISRVTTAQRTAIVSPANGLLLFDTNTNSFWYFSSSWKELKSFTLPYIGSASDPDKVFSITNSNGNVGSSAIYGKNQFTSGITTAHTKGIWGDTYSGVGVFGTSANIGILGMTPSSTNAIAVKGISTSSDTTSGAITGINERTGVAVYGESTGGGIAVYGKTTRQNGAAIYGINDATHGQGIRGSATGTDGVAIYGEAGNSNSSSYAGYFRNSNASNSRNVIQVDNLGTGNFLSLTDGLANEKTTIAKNGNIMTDGTLTVKSDKGIVRNTNSTQLRYEVMNAVFEGLNGASLTLQPGTEAVRTINFSTPFSSPPYVTVGNVFNTTGSGGLYLLCYVYNVTATSFKLRIDNVSSIDLTFTATWKVMAIGPE